MHDTTIKSEHGYLGHFPWTLDPRNMQSMIFKTSDVGPFSMMEKECNDKRHDRTIEGQFVTRQYKKAELIEQLKEHGVTARGNKTAVQKLAQECGLPIQEIAKTLYGWEGKPKGLLQVLWEQGFINRSKLSCYTMHGMQDPFGVTRKDTSLKILMSNCQDFKEEESLLQSMGREGIEYSWGSQKRGKKNFRAVVRKCLS